MDWRSIRFDWNRARAFLVAAEEGSYSAAARALGLTQPTLGRQVAALEAELELTLFDRGAQGLSLTPAGLELVEQARAMGTAASALSRVATGQSQRVEGLVRITASEVISAFNLPPVLAGLRRAHPGIRLEVVASDELRDLRRREADIALRSARPADPDLVARRLGEGEAHLYGSESYLAELAARGGDLLSAEFVGFAENGPLVAGLRQMGLAVTQAHFCLTSGSILVQWQMVQAGLGLGIMTADVGDATPGVARAAPEMAPFRYEIWLAAHRELATSRRLRIVFDALADAFGRGSG
jgi:DNA-binding transcriptional LysR family regulator